MNFRCAPRTLRGAHTSCTTPAILRLSLEIMASCAYPLVGTMPSASTTRNLAADPSPMVVVKGKTHLNCSSRFRGRNVMMEYFAVMYWLVVKTCSFLILPFLS